MNATPLNRWNWAARAGASLVLVESLFVLRIATRYCGTYGAGETLEFLIYIRATAEAQWLLVMFPLATAIAAAAIGVLGAGLTRLSRTLVVVFIVTSGYVLWYEWVAVSQLLERRIF